MPRLTMLIVRALLAPVAPESEGRPQVLYRLPFALAVLSCIPFARTLQLNKGTRWAVEHDDVVIFLLISAGHSSPWHPPLLDLFVITIANFHLSLMRSRVCSWQLGLLTDKASRLVLALSTFKIE